MSFLFYYNKKSKVTMVDAGITNTKNLFGGAYWIGIIVLLVYLLSLTSNTYRILFVALVLVMAGTLGPEKPNLFMETCTNHSTATACANWGQCDLVDKAFAIDKDWALLQRNTCVEGMPTEKTRLLNSYDPSRCEAWGGCTPECVEKLTAIKSQIENVSCSKEFGEDASLEDIADEFPLASSSFLFLFPFNREGFWQIWAGFGIALCFGLMLARLAKMETSIVP